MLKFRAAAQNEDEMMDMKKAESDKPRTTLKSSANEPTRRDFVKAAGAGVATAATLPHIALASDTVESTKEKKTRVGVIGCGSVSTKYLPSLKECEYAELVSVCDIIPERAEEAGKKYGVPHYPHIDQMLAGPDFDLFVDLTDMNEHGRLNKQALEARKHVWSEKPMAGSHQEGKALVAIAKKRGLQLLAAPFVVASPQFAFMEKTLGDKALGLVAAAHASYGHTGPSWRPHFYKNGGGCLRDLAVYQLTTLTGLLGPAKSVVAMTSILTPTRTMRDGSEINVEVDDNTMFIMEHGNGVFSHIQSGFNYFKKGRHDSAADSAHTMTITGRDGEMSLAGYDWAPHGVDLITAETRGTQRHATQLDGYLWPGGASHMAECLATGKKPVVSQEQVLHVLEVMDAVDRSQETGRRVKLESTFPLPLRT